MIKLSETERKTLLVWAIVALIVFLIVLLVASKQVRNKQEREENLVAPGTREVLDRSRYYTIKGALEKYYSYINMKDKDAVVKILSSKYVKENKITKNNVDKFVKFEDFSKTIKTNIICLKTSKKGIYTFAVSGVEINRNTNEKKEDVYYEVELDGNTSLFSVKPITEKNYSEVCHG